MDNVNNKEFYKKMTEKLIKNIKISSKFDL